MFLIALSSLCSATKKDGKSRLDEPLSPHESK